MLESDEWWKTIEPGAEVIVFPSDCWKDERNGSPVRRIFGTGEYLGYFVPPVVLDTEGEGLIISFDDETDEIEIVTDGRKDPDYNAEDFNKIPKIRLANGKEIWGHECYWRPLVLGGVNRLEEMISQGLSINTIDIDEVRRRWFEDSNPGVNN